MPKPDWPSPAAYDHAAWMLLCDPAMLQAFAITEAGHLGAFDAQDQPTLLYERHVFNKLTENRFTGATTPLISPPNNVLAAHSRGGYGAPNIQHLKLDEAIKLDRTKALESCSWGLFQIMGFNHKRCGYDSVQRFVNAMYRGVDDHLRALTMYIRSDSRLVDAIRNKDFATTARLYNGSDYRANQYDTKMRENFLRIVQDKMRNA